MTRVPLVISYHPAPNIIGKVAQGFRPMFSASDENIRVFPEPLLASFKRCKHHSDTLIRFYRRSA